MPFVSFALRRICTVMVAGAFLALSASAQTLPRVPFEQYQLANGLRVILSVNKSMPAVNVNLWYHVGAKNERPGRTGFAHLFEHMMFQGSKHLPGEYFSYAERAGANVMSGGLNGTTSEDRTNYFETVPSGSLEFALWMEADRMGFLVDGLTKEKLSNQQDVVKNEKRQSDNEPYNIVEELVATNLYPVGHPYGHTVIGSMDDLTAATMEDVTDFFRTWYTPNNCVLTVVGDFDPAQAKALIKKHFGPIPSGPAVARPTIDIPTLSTTKRIVARDRAPQARLYLYYPVPQMYSAVEPALDFAASALGKGKNSLLYKKLVQDLGLASGVAVYNSCREISGEFTIVVTARPGKSLEEIRTVVDQELAAFAKSGPKESDLLRERAQMEMAFLSGLERIGGFGGIADRLNSYMTFLGDPDKFQWDFDRYQTVTTADVTREFNHWIAGKPRLEIEVIPESGGRPDAPEFDRTKEPPTADVASVALPTPQKTTLPNGLDVVVLSRPGLPKVEGVLIIKSQNLSELEAKSGASFLTAAMVDEGTRTRTGAQIREELELLGTSMNIGGGKFGATMSFAALKKNLGPSFSIFSDVILHPAFPEKDFERERKLAMDAALRAKSNPSSLANRAFMKAVFPNHPVGVPSSGTEASLKGLTVADLQAVYDQHWKPNNAVLILTGDIDLVQAEKLAKEHFGGWKKGTVTVPSLPKPSAPSTRTVYLIDKQNAPQSFIMVGSTAPNHFSPEYLKIQLMNGLFGGAFGSRLNMNLREDKGYTYGAFCNIAMEAEYGFWAVGTGVQTKFTVPSLTEIRKEILGMRGEIPIADKELDDIRKNLTRGYSQNFESLNQLLGETAPYIQHGYPMEQLTGFIAGVNRCTPSDVLSTARSILDFDHATVVVVGDLAQIEKPIRDLGWGTVVVLDADGAVIR